MEHFAATLTVCMGQTENGKEERGKSSMAHAASSKVKPRTLNFSAAAAKRDQEVKNQKKNVKMYEKKGLQKKEKKRLRMIVLVSLK